MDILGITIWREARSEGTAGMAAVYNVILNRAKTGRLWPTDPEKVCLQPYQFSCWNTVDHQRQKYPAFDDLQYKQIQLMIAGLCPDPTGGATAYFDNSIAVPSWAQPSSLKCQIGNLKFYKI